ncbi:MAG TPA: DUF2182 domain-containing protein [Gemmatimonadales bacterium]|nr:DUF2182 domain-containing protein [Gemmatimonadales bacterium]
MLGALRTADDDRWYRLALGLLVLAAWVVLALWGASPQAGRLHHDPAHHAESAAVAGTGEDASSPVSGLLVFVPGWMLMTVAMMLPGMLPLLNLFRRVTSGRAHRDLLLILMGLGYLAVWAVFGVAAYGGDRILHELVDRILWLRRAAWSIPAIVLLGAGIYQFTSLKEKCLAECRSPYAFLVGSWHGRRPGREAWQLGLRHGVFCAGCCWTLMLLMFAVGVAHLGWMLALGAVMSAERAMPWGRRLTRPAGALLILWGALLIVRGALRIAAGLPA